MARESGTGTGTVLIERDAEVDVFARAIQAAKAGSAASLLLEGPAGIGKSRLLAAAATIARDEGLRLLQARGSELERDFAYGVLRQLVERPVVESDPAQRRRLLAGAAALAQPALGLAIAPGAQTPSVGDPELSAMHGFHWLVVHLADAGPLMLVVDDLHWADSQSLRFFAYLASRLAGLPVLVALATRSDEPPANPMVMAHIGGGAGFECLRPRELSLEGVGRMLESELGRPCEAPFVSACQRATGGNPFLLCELIATLRADVITPTAANAARVGEMGPRTVSRSILTRVARLDRAAAEVASAVAVLGCEAELSHVAAVAELELEHAAQAADALASIGILRSGMPFAFAHPIMLAAVYADLPAARRALLHRQAATSLATHGADAERVAIHLNATVPTGSADVAQTLSRAAASAMARRAPAPAVAWLRRALREPPPEAQRGVLLADLGTAELLAGEAPAAADHLREAAGLANSPAQRAQRAADFARATMAAGGLAEAIAVLESARRELGDHDHDHDVRLRLAAELTTIALYDDALRTRLGPQLPAYADLPGNTAAERVLLACMVQLRAFERGASATAVALLARRALADGALLHDLSADDPLYYLPGHYLVAADVIEPAVASFDAALADARARGSLAGAAVAGGLRGEALLRLGQVSEGAADARGGFEAAMQLEPSPARLVIGAVTTAVLIAALCEQGELDEAESVLARAADDDALIQAPANSQVHFLYHRGRLRLAQRRHADALADFSRGLELMEHAQYRHPTVACEEGLATVAARLGQAERAVALSDARIGRARAWGAGSWLARALRCRAYVDPERRRIDLLEEAVAAARASPSRLELAKSQVALGTALRHDGHRADAREPLRLGLELARGCGARALAQRAYEELRVAGARPRRQQFSGVESVTASERRVTEMAAAPMSSREIAQSLFVTTRTVESHLAHAYRKLGISSRVELARALASDAQPDAQPARS